MRVGYGQIGEAIAVQVGDGNGIWSLCPTGIRYARLEGPIPGSKEHGHVVTGRIGRDQIGLSISVQIAGPPRSVATLLAV
ncbi:MAG: hypothetical protein WDO73_19795 [Ignavibacteriota bacterium]